LGYGFLECRTSSADKVGRRLKLCVCVLELLETTAKQKVLRFTIGKGLSTDQQ